MKLAKYPLFFGRLMAAAILLLAIPAFAAETLVNITGTGVELTFVQIDCASAAGTTGLSVAAGATLGSLNGIEVKNCTTRGVAVAESVAMSNSWVHDNQDDLDIAAGKTVTVVGKNVFDDSLADKGAGTYTDAGGLTLWENTLGAAATRTGGTPFLTYAQWWAAGGDLRGKGPTGGGYSVGPVQYQKRVELDFDELLLRRSKSTDAGSYTQ